MTVGGEICNITAVTTTEVRTSLLLIIVEYVDFKFITACLVAISACICSTISVS